MGLWLKDRFAALFKISIGVLSYNLLPKIDRRFVFGHLRCFPSTWKLVKDFGRHMASNSLALKFGDDKKFAYIPIHIRGAADFAD